MVNIPDAFDVRVELGGGLYKSFTQMLDMRNGLYTRKGVWQDASGRETEICFRRFFSMADKHTAAYKITLKALNYSGSARITLAVDAGVENLPVHDDQTIENEQTTVMLRPLEINSDSGGLFMLTETRTGRLKIAQHAELWGGAGTNASTSKRAAREFNLTVEQGVEVEAGAIIKVYCSRDGEKYIDECKKPLDTGFDGLLAKSGAAWQKLWEQSDIQVDADTRTQSALRYNIFQLLQNCPAGDSTVSIGARGLTHGRYKGCYFWDTDIFLLPFYIYSRPEAAKDLVKFRLSTLGDAKANAEFLNLDGARYPWMCAIGGAEQCHTWDIGRSEIHITADVVFTIENYMNITGDRSIEKQAGQVYIETARYWASRFTYDPREDQYNLLFVKGPDEYCGVTHNNVFTVMMARYNLELGIKAAEQTREVPEPEVMKWREICEKSKVNYDEEKNLFIQDDDFLKLEPFDFSGRSGDGPSYQKISYDRLQRYQVLKQADLVLLILLLPDGFTAEQKLAIWNFYEPLTLHDSTLSYGAHAYAAARLGQNAKAREYFYKSLLLDLEDIMRNTGREGIHMAALGATWQSVVLGFAGLTPGADGNPVLMPNLPRDWNSVSFKFFAGGKQYRAAVTHEAGIVEEVKP